VFPLTSEQKEPESRGSREQRVRGFLFFFKLGHTPSRRIGGGPPAARRGRGALLRAGPHPRREVCVWAGEPPTRRTKNEKDKKNKKTLPRTMERARQRQGRRIAGRGWGNAGSKVDWLTRAETDRTTRPPPAPPQAAGPPPPPPFQQSAVARPTPRPGLLDVVRPLHKKLSRPPLFRPPTSESHPRTPCRWKSGCSNAGHRGSALRSISRRWNFTTPESANKERVIFWAIAGDNTTDAGAPVYTTPHTQLAGAGGGACFDEGRKWSHRYGLRRGGCESKAKAPFLYSYLLSSFRPREPTGSGSYRAELGEIYVGTSSASRPVLATNISLLCVERRTDCVDLFLFCCYLLEYVNKYAGRCGWGHPGRTFHARGGWGEGGVGWVGRWGGVWGG
jgi:hypothetical protein